MSFIDTGVTIFDRIFGAVEKYNELKFSKKTLLRALYFEISNNISLLESINMDMLKNLKVNSSAVFSIINNMEIQVSASILFSDGKTTKEIFNLLKIKSDIPQECEDGKKNIKTEKNILQMIMFIIEKITLLQKLSSFKSDDENEITNTLRLKVRIENIKTHLKAVKDLLKSIDATNEPFLIKSDKIP